MVDVETSGLSPSRHRVVEIAAVQTSTAGRIVNEWTTILNPEGSVGRTDIHGITAADARTAPRFRDVAGELVELLSGRVLVAHNAPFDVGFLEAEFGRLGYSMPRPPSLCTLEASRRYLPDLDRRRLIDCCWVCGIRLDDAHSALGDARATAHLLAHYLDPDAGRPPLAEHVALPKRAAGLSWPLLPKSGIAPRPRSGTAVTQAAPPGTLWRLLDALPLSTVLDEGAPEASLPYLELLFQVFEDGVLTEDEAAGLADLAKAYVLTREQLHAAHGAFLIALAHRIVEDGVITPAERDLLLDASRALGFSDDLPERVLKEAWAVRERTPSGAPASVPPGWALGEPLRMGQSIAFTGCDQIVRAKLEGQALAAGLRVTGSVSGRTALLVTDGSNPTTRKAVAARERGIRTVTPTVFAQMLAYVLPPEGSGVPAEQGRAQAIPVARPATDPATVRAWAAAHGYRVGVRGRIGIDVLAAYEAAHQR